MTIKFQEMTTGLGGSSTSYNYFRYTDYRSALNTHASTDDDETALTYLSTNNTDPVVNKSTISMKVALGRALGLTAVAPGSHEPTTAA